MSKKLIIGFSKSKMIGSKIIRWLEKSSFSHVYLKWHSDSYDRDIIYQASGLAVNFVGAKSFEEHHTVVKELEIEVTDEQFKACMQFCIDKSGVPYGFKSLVGMGYVKLMGKLGKKVNNPFRDGSKCFVCSELVGTILEKDFQIKLDLDLEIDGPEELYNKLKSIL